MHIFWFYYSKYSPLASIHLQRFNSDSNACSSSVCGIASSACVEADWSSKIECHQKSVLSISISILGSRRGPNQVNTVNGLTQRHDFEPKIDDQ